MRKRYQRILSLLLTIALIFSTMVGAGKNNVKAAELGKDKMKTLLAQKMDKQLASQVKNKKLADALKADKDSLEENGGKSLNKYNPDEKIRIIVQLKDAAAVETSAKDLSPVNSTDATAISSAVNEVKSSQLTVQQKVEAITGEKVKRSYGYLINGFSITAKRSDILKIQTINGVKSVTEAKTYYPDMAFAKNLTQAFEAWSDLGYKGEGMVVSIIDTGIDYTHKDLQAVPASPKLTDTTPDGPGKYYTSKVPYGYNFADGNDDIVDRNPNTEMHGLHVAGIVAANGKDSDIDSLKAIKGVAPEAQLLAMKVFSNNPGGASAYDDDIIAAIEDSVLHGADVINMSLGSTAGFQDANDPEQQAVKNAVDQGVVVVISAGNSAISTTDNGWNIPQTNWFGTVDTATVGSPGTTKDALTVASYENNRITAPGFDYTSETENNIEPLAYSPIEVDPLPVFKDPAGYPLVDCGQGNNTIEKTGDDFDPAKVTGKIALVQKVSGTYGSKKRAAQAAGAIGVIFYNGEGDDSVVSVSSLPDIVIPCITTTYTNGAKLKSLLDKNVRVHFNGKLTSIPNPDEGDISPYTSWGPTPSLDFKPEIMAPGGDIYSLANGDKYQTMSGTSMAAPHTSGSEALIVEAAKKNLGLTGRDLVEYAKNTTINTAKVEMDKRHIAVPYSPRRQGAGMVQIKDAINNKVTVTDNTGDAAVTLKQIGKTTTFTLNLKNFGSTNLTFNPVKDFVLHETTDGDTLEPFETPIAGATMNFDKSTVTVPANGQAQVTVTLTLPDAFDKQQFVEGYIKINSADTAKNPSLEVPFIGFYGDWSAMDSIDKPMWDENSIIGAFGFSAYNGGTVLEALNPLIGTLTPMGATIVGGKVVIDPDKIAMSNAGILDTLYPMLIPNLYLLRNVKEFKAELLDENKNILRTLDLENNVRKDVFEDDLAAGSLGTLKAGAAWFGDIYNANTGNYEIATQGQYYIRFTTKSDIDGASEQVIDMPVKVDSTAPVLDIKSSDTSAGAQYLLNWTASDNYTGMDNSFIAIAVNGNEISDYSTLQNNGNDYSISLNLQPGMNNTIEMITMDYAGNYVYTVKTVKAGSENTVYFDNISNGIKINNDMVEDNKYTITGIVRNDVKTLKVNDSEVTINEDLSFKVPVAVADGANTISVVTLDASGNELTNNNITVNCDLTLPVINLTSPQVNEKGFFYTDSGTVTISGNVQDPNLKSVYINGKAVTVSNGAFSKTFTVSGTTQFGIYALDTYGNRSEDKYITVARTSPFEVNFDNLESFNVVTAFSAPDDTYLITGSVNHRSSVFKINDTDVAVNDDLTFEVPVKLTQGNNIVKVYAEEAGTIVYNYSFKVLFDSQAPNLTISQPVANGDGKVYTNQDKLTIKGQISDNTYGYMLYINGNMMLNVDRYPSVGNDGNRKDFSYDINVANGDKISIQLIDEFGNVTEDALDVVVDKTAPKAPAITSSNTQPTNQDVTVTVSKDSSDTDISKVEYSFDHNTWLTYTEPFKVVANNTVYAKVTDFAGNASESSLTISNIDKTAPVISITTPIEGGAYREKVTPAVSVNEGTYTMELDGDAYIGGDITTEGTHVLVVNAVDAVGNTASKTVNFAIDNTAPKAPAITLSNTQPTNQDVTITISKDSSDTDIISVEYSLDQRTWLAYTEPFKVAANTTVYARVADLAGNVTEASLTISNIDKTAPKAPAITSSNTQPTNQDVTITVAKDPSDEDISKIEYSFDHNTWLTYAEPFKVAANTTVYARVTDFAGNTTEVNLVVANIDKTAPVIAIGAPTEGGYYRDKVTSNISVNEGTYTMKLDDKDFTGGDITAEGSHVLVVNAVDPAGNTSSKTVNFIIDKTAPVVTVSGVEDGKEYNNKVTAKITSNEGKLLITLDGNAYNGDDITSLGSHSLIAVAVDNAGNTTTKTIKFTIKPVLSSDVPVDLVASSIGNSKEKQVNVSLDNTTTIDDSIFKAVSGQEKSVSFTVNSNNTEVTWTFNAKEIDPNNIKDIDLSVNVQAPNKDTIEKIDSNAQILSFKDNGVLPAPATLKIKLDPTKMDLTQPVYFYYYNPTTKATELIAGPLTPDKDGYVEVIIKHCSDYFFSNNDNQKTTEAVANLPKTGYMLDMNILVGIGILLTAVGTLFVVRRRRNE